METQRLAALPEAQVDTHLSLSSALPSSSSSESAGFGATPPLLCERNEADLALELQDTMAELRLGIKAMADGLVAFESGSGVVGQAPCSLKFELLRDSLDSLKTLARQRHNAACVERQVFTQLEAAVQAAVEAESQARGRLAGLQMRGAAADSLQLALEELLSKGRLIDELLALLTELGAIAEAPHQRAVAEQEEAVQQALMRERRKHDPALQRLTLALRQQSANQTKREAWLNAELHAAWVREKAAAQSLASDRADATWEAVLAGLEAADAKRALASAAENATAAAAAAAAAIADSNSLHHSAEAALLQEMEEGVAAAAQGGLALAQARQDISSLGMQLEEAHVLAAVHGHSAVQQDQHLMAAEGEVLAEREAREAADAEHHQQLGQLEAQHQHQLATRSETANRQLLVQWNGRLQALAGAAAAAALARAAAHEAELAQKAALERAAAARHTGFTRSAEFLRARLAHSQAVAQQQAGLLRDQLALSSQQLGLYRAEAERLQALVDYLQPAAEAAGVEAAEQLELALGALDAQKGLSAGLRSQLLASAGRVTDLAAQLNASNEKLLANEKVHSAAQAALEARLAAMAGQLAAAIQERNASDLALASALAAGRDLALQVTQLQTTLAQTQADLALEQAAVAKHVASLNTLSLQLDSTSKADGEQRRILEQRVQDLQARLAPLPSSAAAPADGAPSAVQGLVASQPKGDNYSCLSGGFTVTSTGLAVIIRSGGQIEAVVRSNAAGDVLLESRLPLGSIFQALTPTFEYSAFLVHMQSLERFHRAVESANTSPRFLIELCEAGSGRAWWRPTGALEGHAQWLLNWHGRENGPSDQLPAPSVELREESIRISLPPRLTGFSVFEPTDQCMQDLLGSLDRTEVNWWALAGVLLALAQRQRELVLQLKEIEDLRVVEAESGLVGESVAGREGEVSAVGEEGGGAEAEAEAGAEVAGEEEDAASSWGSSLFARSVAQGSGWVAAAAPQPALQAVPPLWPALLDAHAQALKRVADAKGSRAPADVDTVLLMPIPAGLLARLSLIGGQPAKAAQYLQPQFFPPTFGGEADASVVQDSEVVLLREGVKISGKKLAVIPETDRVILRWSKPLITPAGGSADRVYLKKMVLLWARVYALHWVRIEE